MPRRRDVVSGLAAAVATPVVAEPDAARPAVTDPAELRRAIVGHTMYTTGRRFGVRWHWAGFYRADGRAFARAWWGFGEIRATSAWEIGDGRWCQLWKGVDWSRGARNCYRVHRTTDGLHWRHVAGPHASDHRFERRAGDPFALAP